MIVYWVLNVREWIEVPYVCMFICRLVLVLVLKRFEPTIIRSGYNIAFAKLLLAHLIPHFHLIKTIYEHLS